MADQKRVFALDKISLPLPFTRRGFKPVISDQTRGQLLEYSKDALVTFLVRCYAKKRTLEQEMEEGEEVVAYQRCCGGDSCVSPVHYHKVGYDSSFLPTTSNEPSYWRRLTSGAGLKNHSI